jgi:hypothetical protein
MGVLCLIDEFLNRASGTLLASIADIGRRAEQAALLSYIAGTRAEAKGAAAAEGTPAVFLVA